VVGDAAVTRHHQRPAGAMGRRNGDVDQPVQAVDDGVQAAAGLDVDDRIVRQIEQIAGADDVGLAEQHDAVAVGVRGLVHDDHRLVVEVEALLRRRVGVVRPCRFRRRRLLAGRRGHAAEHVHVRDDRRAPVVDRPLRARRVAAVTQRNRLAPCGDRRIATRVFGVVGRVDDVAKPPARDRLHGGPDFVAHGGNAGVDDEDAFFAGLYGDVAARADHHEDVALHRQDLNLARGRLAQGRPPHLRTLRGLRGDALR
jgi:hypothetical protein